MAGFAWLVWAIIHVYLLVGFQHRLQVSIQWLWRYLACERGARLVAEEHIVQNGSILKRPPGIAEEGRSADLPAFSRRPAD